MGESVAAAAAKSGNEAAAEKILRHHAAMAKDLEEHVAELGRAVSEGRPHAEAAKRVANCLAGEIFPHAEAEEATLYAAAERRTEAVPLVSAMVAEHRRLRRSLSGLVAARDGVLAYGAARAAAALFEAHAEKENEQLLPLLVRDPEVDLGALLDEMHRRTEEGRAAAAPVGDDGGAEADGGSAEADGDAAERADEDDPELDVRELPHAERHTMIFGLLERLRPGQALVVVNDHDPQPLRYQLNAMWPGRFEWEYRDRGPVVWRVAIRRTHGG